MNASGAAGGGGKPPPAAIGGGVGNDGQQKRAALLNKLHEYVANKKATRSGKAPVEIAPRAPLIKRGFAWVGSKNGVSVIRWVQRIKSLRNPTMDDVNAVYREVSAHVFRAVLRHPDASHGRTHLW
jgi:hypothetical protein